MRRCFCASCGIFMFLLGLRARTAVLRTHRGLAVPAAGGHLDQPGTHLGSSRQHERLATGQGRLYKLPRTSGSWVQPVPHIGEVHPGPLRRSYVSDGPWHRLWLLMALPSMLTCMCCATVCSVTSSSPCMTATSKSMARRREYIYGDISCDSFGPAAHLQAVRSWYSIKPHPASHGIPLAEDHYGYLLERLVPPHSAISGFAAHA